MSNLRLPFLLLLTFSSLTRAYGQHEQKCREMLYQAFVTHDAELAIKATDSMEEFYRVNKEDSILFLLTYAQQSTLGFDLEEDYFDELYEKAKINAEALVENESLESYGHTFLASIYASRMGRSTMSAMFLAPKNKSELKLALESDNRNPLAWLQFGGYKFYAPGFFGGDLEEAVEAFEKSVRLYENRGDLLLEWDYLGALNLLRRSYEKSGREKEAAAIIEKARAIEPRLKWVKKS